MYDGFGYLGLDTSEEVRQQLIDEEEAAEKVAETVDCWTDEVGGHHDSGIGWAPNGQWCGECSKSSCKNCIVWKSIKRAIAKEID